MHGMTEPRTVPNSWSDERTVKPLFAAFSFRVWQRLPPTCLPLVSRLSILIILNISSPLVRDPVTSRTVLGFLVSIIRRPSSKNPSPKNPISFYPSSMLAYPSRIEFDPTRILLQCKRCCFSHSGSHIGSEIHLQCGIRGSGSSAATRCENANSGVWASILASYSTSNLRPI